MHYGKEREAELELIEKHEIKDIDMSHYTKQMWFDDIHTWLVDVMGMNEKQARKHFDKHFQDLLERGLGL